MKEAIAFYNLNQRLLKGKTMNVFHFFLYFLKLFSSFVYCLNESSQLYFSVSVFSTCTISFILKTQTLRHVLGTYTHTHTHFRTSIWHKTNIDEIKFSNFLDCLCYRPKQQVSRAPALLQTLAVLSGGEVEAVCYLPPDHSVVPSLRL